MKRSPASFAAFVAVLSLAPFGAGCDRRPALVPASADSTAAGVDSFTVHARQALDAWDAGDDATAATASARVTREALEARPNAPWPERARGVLDSLGIGAEVTGNDRATVVNLFSRMRGEGDSWPWLFWREDGAVRSQALEARGWQLSGLAARGMTDTSEPTDSAQVAVLWNRRVGAGGQPQLTVWRHAAGGRWDLVQALGPDSLGGVGSGEFTGDDTTTTLTTRTYRTTPYFDECGTCPHVFQERLFDWGPGGFTRIGTHPVPSPYSTFTAFVNALIANDRTAAIEQVVDPSLVDFARKFEWNVPSRGRWRIAPATDESAIEMVFFRGQKDAYRVTFEARDGDWVIAGFEPTSRAVE